MNNVLLIAGGIFIVYGIACVLTKRAYFVLFQILPGDLGDGASNFYTREHTPWFYYFSISFNFILGALLLYMGLS